MVTSAKFPSDCLFFVFEQDFELYPGGNLPVPEGRVGAELAASSAQSSSSTGPHQRGQKRKEAAEEPAAVPSSASDLVMMVNAAARKGVGDLVWLGYQPKSNRPGKWNAPRVRFGTQLVVLTKASAQRIGRVMSSGFWKADHIDVWLLKFCQDHRFSEGRCSYVFPPIGSFGTHDSECCPEEGTRKSWWDADFTAVGTRPCEDVKGHRSKDVYGFTEEGKGHVDHRLSLRDSFFAGQEGCWRTFVNLQKTTDAAHTTQLVARRRRRELATLKFRCHVDNPSLVFRRTKCQTGFTPPHQPPQRIKKCQTELSFQPLLRTLSSVLKKQYVSWRGFGFSESHSACGFPLPSFW